MKFFVVSLSAFLIAAGMAAAAAAEVARDAAPDIVEIFPRMEADIQKRGYGCGVFSDDVGICNFHCINDVTKNCGGGRVIRPYKGVCGGFASAVCQCVYKVNC